MPAMPLPPAMHSRCFGDVGVKIAWPERREDAEARALDRPRRRASSLTAPPGFFFTTKARRCGCADRS